MEKYTFGEVLNRMSLVDMPSKIKSLMTDIEQEMIMSFYPTKAKYCR
jgi:5'-3' exonuclease